MIVRTSLHDTDVSCLPAIVMSLLASTTVSEGDNGKHKLGKGD